MTAPGLARPAGRGIRRPAARPRLDRWAGLVEGYFRLHALLTYLFLFLPIVVVVVFAFNATTQATTAWEGFSLRWFGIALGDGVVQDALANSFWIAVPNAFLATAFGAMAALGLQRVGKRIRLGFDVLTYMSIIVPEIVIALATLILFATSFDAIQSWFGIKLHFGRETIIAAHVLFNTSLVLLLVRARLSGMDRSLVDASSDLFRHAVAHLPTDHVPATPAGSRRRLPEGVHVQL